MSRRMGRSSASAGMPAMPEPHGDGPLVHDPVGGQVLLLGVVDDEQAQGARVLQGAPRRPRR